MTRCQVISGGMGEAPSRVYAEGLPSHGSRSLSYSTLQGNGSPASGFCTHRGGADLARSWAESWMIYLRSPSRRRMQGSAPQWVGAQITRRTGSDRHPSRVCDGRRLVYPALGWGPWSSSPADRSIAPSGGSRSPVECARSTPVRGQPGVLSHWGLTLTRSPHELAAEGRQAH